MPGMYDTKIYSQDKETASRLIMLDVEAKKILGGDPTDRRIGDASFRLFNEYKRVKAILNHIRTLTYKEL